MTLGGTSAVGGRSFGCTTSGWASGLGCSGVPVTELDCRIVGGTLHRGWCVLVVSTRGYCGESAAVRGLYCSWGKVLERSAAEVTDSGSSRRVAVKRLGCSFAVGSCFGCRRWYYAVESCLGCIRWYRAVATLRDCSSAGEKLPG